MKRSFINRVIIACALNVFSLTCISSSPDSIRASSFEINLNQYFSYSGHVRVREFQYPGTFFNLKDDLGMNDWSSMELKWIRYKSELVKYKFGLAYNHFSGSAVLRNETWYNGTHLLPGKAKINKTIFLGITAFREGRLVEKNNFRLNYEMGFAYDFLRFYVEGKIDPSSTIKEVYENFFRQELPLPNVGINFSQDLSEHFFLTGEITGTILPKIKTPFKEGGNIYLSQKNATVVIRLNKKYKKIQIHGGLAYRYFSLFEESGEDTNDFLIKGIAFEVGSGF